MDPSWLKEESDSLAQKKGPTFTDRVYPTHHGPGETGPGEIRVGEHHEVF